MPIVAFALISPIQPFGGKVLLAPIPAGECPGGAPVSPYSIEPVFGPPGAYVTTQFVGGFGYIRPDSWILGLYNVVPLPECAAPPPFSNAFRTIIYGTDTLF